MPISITTRLVKGNVAKALEACYRGCKTGTLTIKFDQGVAEEIEFQATSPLGVLELEAPDEQYCRKKQHFSLQDWLNVV